jgi:outer membrane protein TolC
MTTRPFRRRAGARVPPLAACLLVALLLAGCAGPGLGARHRELERGFASSGPAPALASGPLREPSPAGEDPFAGAAEIERGALVREVLRRNPSIEAARQAWGAALERFPQATSLDDPSAGYSVAPSSFGSSRVEDGHRVDVAQRLPFPGKLGLRGEVALAAAEAAASDFEAARRRLAETASLLFDDHYFVARALEINAAHLALLEELLEIAAARYAAGLGSQQDPLQAELERARLLHDERGLQAERRITCARLNALLHRPPEAPLPPPPAQLGVVAAEPSDRAALVERALRERPELRAADARLRGRESSVALAHRDFFPDVTLVGGWDGFWQKEERELRTAVGLEIELPIRFARRRAALAEARAELAAAASERAALEDEVRLEVETAAERLAEGHHLTEILESRLLPAARDRVAAARAGFESGRNDFDTLIEAERSLREAELERERALAELSRRHAELARAIGAVPGLP